MGRTYACIWSKCFELFDDPKTLTFIKPFATYFVKKRFKIWLRTEFPEVTMHLTLTLRFFPFVFKNITENIWDSLENLGLVKDIASKIYPLYRKEDTTELQQIWPYTVRIIHGLFIIPCETMTKGLSSKLQLWNSLLRPTYVIDRVDNTGLPCYTLPTTQHHSFFRNLPHFVHLALASLFPILVILSIFDPRYGFLFQTDEKIHVNLTLLLKLRMVGTCFGPANNLPPNNQI